MTQIANCSSDGAQKAGIPCLDVFFVKLVGTAPLVMSRFGAQIVHPEHRPYPLHWCGTCRDLSFADSFIEFCYRMYWKDGVPRHVNESDVAKAVFQIPAIMIKKAAVCACRLVRGITMLKAKQSFFITGHDEQHYSDILGRPVKVRQRYRRSSGRKTDTFIRYHARFDSWACVLKVQNFPNQMADTDVLSLLRRAGIQVGTGMLRPSQTGACGTFTVELFEEKDLPAWRRQIQNQI